MKESVVRSVRMRPELLKYLQEVAEKHEWTLNKTITHIISKHKEASCPVTGTKQ